VRFEKLGGADVELVQSAGEVFEIAVDGTLALSKKHLGRFSTDEAVDALARCISLVLIANAPVYY
jgi:predicted Rdx family selenoprotein